jgi:phosphoglycerate dehydrogenase-like enzyme
MTDKTSLVYVILGNAQWDFADCQQALGRASARMIQLPHMKNEDEMIARTRDADALVVSSWPVTRGVMSALEGLKVVVRTGVGYDVIDVPAATDLGVIVVNIPDLWIREVANHALALLLSWNRGVLTMDRQVHAGVWGGRVPGSRTGSLHGETVGIVGLGNIGSAFARRVAALETKVIACDPYVDDKKFVALGVERVSLETLAERSDYVSVHTLLNAETHHLISDAFFRRMKPTAILINTSRGPVVDEQALARALDEKAPGRCGARRLGRRADQGRQPAVEDGQRDRHAARCVLLDRGGRADPGALRRGSRACAGRPAAAQRRESRNLCAGGHPARSLRLKACVTLRARAGRPATFQSEV